MHPLSLEFLNYYAKGNGQIENQLCNKLRSLAPSAQLDVAKEIVARNHQIGREIIKRCNIPGYLEHLIEISLEQGDASTIRWWLVPLLSKYGFKNVFQPIIKHLENNSCQYRTSALSGITYWFSVSSLAKYKLRPIDLKTHQQLLATIKKLGIS